MGLFQKIKDFFFPTPKFYLTIQGYYFLKYIKKIVDGSWKEESDYIEDYENTLENIRKELCLDDGSSASREEAAEAFITMVAQLEVIPCEELIEIGINSFEQI